MNNLNELTNVGHSGTLTVAGTTGSQATNVTVNGLAASPHAYYQADGNGNITALVSSNQLLLARYEYDPYGNILSQSGPLADANLYRFSSKEFHANSGLVYYLYRFYDPNLQRWLNRDPLGEPGFENLRGLRTTRESAIWAGTRYIALKVSSNWNPLGGGPNLYAYVKNIPISQTDLYGLDAFWDFYKPLFYTECGFGAALGINDAIVASIVCDRLKPGDSAYIVTRLGSFLGIFAGAPVAEKVWKDNAGNCHSSYFYQDPGASPREA